MRYLLVLLTLSIMLGCQPKDKPTGQVTSTQVGPATQTVNYPPVSQDYLENIVKNADHIDIVFYKYPISVSRDGNADVIQELGRITDQAPLAAANCQPDGRIFYNGKGETIAEADLYIKPDCFYVVFYKAGKPIYANGLTAEAIKFYDDLTKQFRQ